MFLKILQILQENFCVGVPHLIKVHAFRSATLVKRDSSTGVLTKKSAKFFRTRFLQNTSGSLNELNILAKLEKKKKNQTTKIGHKCY